MRSIPVFSMLFLFISCGTDSNWKQFVGNGLENHGDTYNDLYFVDEQIGYIGGMQLNLFEPKSNNTINFQNTAVLSKTVNQGKDWITIPLPFLGSVEKITAFDDTLILKVKTDNDTTLLVQSDNNGKSWKNLMILTNHARIIDMEFTTSTNGRVLTTDRRKSYLVIYHNNRFDTIQTFQNTSPRTFLKNKVVSLKNVPSTGNFSSYFLTDLETIEVKEIKFDKSYFVTSHYRDNDTLYLAASVNNVGCILKLTETGYQKIEMGKYSKYQPDEVFAYGNKLMAIANKRDEVGPIGVIRSFFLSNDGGETWKKEELPSPMCILAPTIYKDKFFISRSCPSGFQLRPLNLD